MCQYRSEVLSTAKILVVDSHPEVLAVARDALKRASYDVLTATSAGEALAILGGDQRVDVLIAEVLLPGVRGTELLKTARRCRPSIAVVLMSGYTNGEIVDSTVVFVPKPFTVGMLIDGVARALKTGAAACNRRHSARLTS